MHTPSGITHAHIRHHTCTHLQASRMHTHELAGPPSGMHRPLCPLAGCRIGPTHAGPPTRHGCIGVPRVHAMGADCRGHEAMQRHAVHCCATSHGGLSHGGLSHGEAPWSGVCRSSWRTRLLLGWASPGGTWRTPARPRNEMHRKCFVAARTPSHM